MNKIELKAIAKKIVKESVRFHMGHWALTGDSIAPCGTIGCIAGYAILRDVMKKKEMNWVNAGEYVNRKVMFSSYDTYDPAKIGAKLLGINASQANVLFYTDQWPDEFQEDYNKITYNGDRDSVSIRKEVAALTAKRIRYFIKTGK